MKKRIFACALIFLLLRPVTAGADDYLYRALLRPSSGSVRSGSTFTVEVVIEKNAYNDFSASVGYDTGLFTYVSCSGAMAEHSGGTVRLAAVHTETQEAGSVAAVLTFRAKTVGKSATGAFALFDAKADISERAISEDAKPAETEGASVSVVPASSGPGGKDHAEHGDSSEGRIIGVVGDQTEAEENPPTGAGDLCAAAAAAAALAWIGMAAAGKKRRR